MQDTKKDEDGARRIAALTLELENLKRSLPAHSIKPAMLMRIEELEEEIEMLEHEEIKRERSNSLDVSRLTRV